MRILYASERPPFPFFLGGAARSTHYLLSALAKEFTVGCLAVGSKDFSDSPWSCPAPEDYDALGITEVTKDGDTLSIKCGYEVQVSKDFRNALRTVIDNFAPDVLWTQLEGTDAIVQIAREKRVRTLFYLRDAEFTPAHLKFIADAGARIVCNSQFLANRVRNVTGKKTAFVYPSLDVAFGVVGDPNGYLTMINPHRVKGIDTFLEIAKLLPKERFLLVESWPLDERALEVLNRRLDEVPNVRFQHRVSDMRKVYSKTKVLLVPSVWEEAFGRVVIEAQSCKIPVIASARGGLPEAVGNGGICVRDFRNAEVWVGAIRRMFSNANAYQAFADSAYSHATSEVFAQGYAARKFFGICSETVAQMDSPLFGLRALAVRLRNALPVRKPFR
jgi:glycosyltransferase involved in cell wall biosynthesis